MRALARRLHQLHFLADRRLCFAQSHMDYLSVQARHAVCSSAATAADSCVPVAQALLWDKEKLNLWQQARLLSSYQKRISD
jgi:hypothetical protein